MIAPVEVLSVNPDGSAGDTEYVNGDVPPDPVTGVKEEAAVPAVRTLELTAVVALSGALTVTKFTVPAERFPAASATYKA